MIILLLFFFPIFASGLDDEQKAGLELLKNTKGPTTIRLAKRIHILWHEQSSKKNRNWKEAAQNLTKLLDDNDFVANVCNDEMNATVFKRYLDSQRRKHREHYTLQPDHEYGVVNNTSIYSFAFPDYPIILGMSVTEIVNITMIKLPDGTFRIRQIRLGGTCIEANDEVLATSILAKHSDEEVGEFPQVAANDFATHVDRLIPFNSTKPDENFADDFSAIIETNPDLDFVYDKPQFLEYMKQFNGRYSIRHEIPYNEYGKEEFKIIFKNRVSIVFRRTYLFQWNMDRRETDLWEFYVLCVFDVAKRVWKIREIILRPAGFLWRPDRIQKFAAIEQIYYQFNDIKETLSLNTENDFEIVKGEVFETPATCKTKEMNMTIHNLAYLVLQIYGNFAEKYGKKAHNPIFQDFIKNVTILPLKWDDKLEYRIRYNYWKNGENPQKIDVYFEGKYNPLIDSYSPVKMFSHCLSDSTQKEQVDDSKMVFLENP